MRKSRLTVLLGIAIVVIGLLAAVPAFAQEITPPAGADLVAASPTQPDVAFAAAGMTVYRTTDGGVTWQETGQLASPARSLAVTGGETPVVVAGTATSGVYRSFNDGASWQAGNIGIGMLPGTILEVNALGVDPADPQVIFAATGYWLGTSSMRFTPVALLASVDSGATWLPVSTLPLNSPRYDSLTAVPGRPLTVDAAAGDVVTTYSPDSAALVALLESPDTPAVQGASAARALGMLNDQSVEPVLTTALQSNDAGVANAAAQALGNLRSETAIPALTAALNGESNVSATTAAEVLTAIGTPDALAPLYAALTNDAMTPSRHAAMGALETLGSPAVPGLLHLAHSESPVVQRNAVEMLGWIADPSAVDGLVAALDASDPAVRAQAAWALGETLDGATQPATVELAAREALAQAAVNDYSPDVRLHAAQALSRLPEQELFASGTATVEPPVAAANYAPVGQESGLRLPGWLAAAMPALRWLIVGLALAAIVLLPWLQNTRDSRRHRHN